jgi:hypothetical protein
LEEGKTMVRRLLPTLLAALMVIASAVAVTASGQPADLPVSELAVTPGDIDSTAAPAVETGAYQVVVDSLPAAAFTIP